MLSFGASINPLCPRQIHPQSLSTVNIPTQDMSNPSQSASPLKRLVFCSSEALSLGPVHQRRSQRQPLIVFFCHLQLGLSSFSLSPNPPDCSFRYVLLLFLSFLGHNAFLHPSHPVWTGPPCPLSFNISDALACRLKVLHLLFPASANFHS